MTKMAQGVAGDVKDMALAEAGKRKIEWANQQMPVLQLIRKRFIKEQPLKGVRLAAVPPRNQRNGEPGHHAARWRSRSGSVRVESAFDAG